MTVQIQQNTPQEIDEALVPQVCEALGAIRVRYGWTVAEMSEHCPSVSERTLTNALGGRASAKSVARILSDLRLNVNEALGFLTRWRDLDPLKDKDTTA